MVTHYYFTKYWHELCNHDVVCSIQMNTQIRFRAFPKASVPLNLLNSPSIVCVPFNLYIFDNVIIFLTP